MATVAGARQYLRTRAAQIALKAALAPMELGEELRAMLLPVLVQEAPVSPDVEDNPYSSAPPRVPGFLRDTLRATVLGGAGSAVVHFTTDASYVHFVIDGTAPHTITPVNGDWLVFNVGGEWVFAHSVDHPGTQPNPFQQRALDITEPERQLAVRTAGYKIVSQTVR